MSTCHVFPFSRMCVCVCVRDIHTHKTYAALKSVREHTKDKTREGISRKRFRSHRTHFSREAFPNEVSINIYSSRQNVYTHKRTQRRMRESCNLKLSSGRIYLDIQAGILRNFYQRQCGDISLRRHHSPRRIEQQSKLVDYKHSCSESMKQKISLVWWKRHAYNIHTSPKRMKEMAGALAPMMVNQPLNK